MNVFKSSIFLAIVACFLWSTAFVGVKYGLHFMSPYRYAGIRFLLSGLMIFPFISGSIKLFFIEIKTNISKILILSFFQIFLLYAMFYPGVDMVSGALAAIVIGASPLVATVVAHFMLKNDKFSMSKLLSIAVGISGVVLISANKFNPLEQGGGKEFIGILLLLLVNVSSAVGNVIVSRTQNPMNPIKLNSAQLMFGGIGLLVLSLFFDRSPINLNVPIGFWLTLLWLSFMSAAAFSIWFVLLKRPNVKVSELNIWKFIIPLSGALLSWSLLPNEKPELIPIIGMGLITVSLIILNVQPSFLKNKKGRN